MGAALGALIARPALQRRHACVLWMGLWSHRRAEGRVHSILSHRGPTHVQEHIRGLIAKLKALRVSLAGTVLARFDAGGSLMKVFARRVIPSAPPASAGGTGGFHNGRAALASTTDAAITPPSSQTRGDESVAMRSSRFSRKSAYSAAATATPAEA